MASGRRADEAYAAVRRAEFADAVSRSGRTRRAIAADAGCHHSLITGMCLGTYKTCTPETARDVARAVGVRVGSIFDLVEPRRRPWPRQAASA